MTTTEEITLEQAEKLIAFYNYYHCIINKQIYNNKNFNFLDILHESARKTGLRGSHFNADSVKNIMMYFNEIKNNKSIEWVNEILREYNLEIGVKENENNSNT